MHIGALEAGGTKMVCAIGDELGNIYDKTVIPTETPDVTVPLMIEYFKKAHVDALGIGCFGPICLDKDDEHYGYITSTPKLSWRSYDIAGILSTSLGVAVGFDTDVNAACLGEVTFGCAQGLSDVVYLTVGTGIGAGIYSGGKLLHGNLHPEAGHILLRRHPWDSYEGKCPYHKDCFEGLASGPALKERFGKSAAEINDPAAWQMEAFYIAQALTNYIMVLAPQKIILGGGVMHKSVLFPLVREEVERLLNGYLVTRELKDIDNYIVPASLNDEQGIKGCLVLGRDAVAK
ncbi:MAG: ROK family protein [Lachnospiraceae bacterium]|nr:ROK family protein [Lachnospiraceae bacterium]